MSAFQDAEFVAVPSQQANVVSTDIEASSGIMHVIDRVILPEMQALRTAL
ncbi:MAG: fasciclin domain-containing protein [Gemmatimonadota bacterium]|nr:fasciclin domain-containing protein [Gemmatimonadota bacterium]